MWRNLFWHSLIAILFCGNIAHAGADPDKVLHISFVAPDSGFDGVLTANAYSGEVNEAIFERLLTYDYLARPARLVPGTAEAMPDVSNGGKTFTFHLRKGIYFTPDPAFKGQRRELVAADYAYTFKRVLDPRNRSPMTAFLAGKIVGLDALASRANKTRHFDYDAPVAGLQTPDRYTLRIELNAPDYNFLYIIAFPSSLGAQAREVIEAYDGHTSEHPVGTGAYMLQQYVTGSKIVLVANPDYRGFVWDFKASASAADVRMVKEMQGKTMPQIGRVEISIIEEEQSRWLAFEGKQLDMDSLPQLVALKALDGDRLKPEYARQGIQLDRESELGNTYMIFNMTDPIVGGYSNEKIALRRAIAMSYNIQAEIDLIRHGQAVRSEMIIPPDIVGYDPQYRSSIAYDPLLANKLLDHFGYKRGADGYRTMPDGKPLVLQIHREVGGTSDQMAELSKHDLARVGIHAEYPVSSFSDNIKAATACKLMMWGAAWGADYPDGEDFLQQLYGPNAHQGNSACYESAAFDTLYRQAMALPPGPERTYLYAQMNRQMEADTPWSLGTVRVRNWIAQPWMEGFKKHPILGAEWQYMDIAKH